MVKRAIYISRMGALSACIEDCRKRGIEEETIAKRSATFPAYRRGEMIGFEAWVPINNDGGIARQPLLEA